MKKFLMITLILLALCNGAMATCYAGSLLDSDCDKIADKNDNCIYTPNPGQQDSDRNGAGDACELRIDSVSVMPADFVFTGRAFETTVAISNGRDYDTNVILKVTMPELGYEAVQYVGLYTCDAKKTSILMRAPDCVPSKDYKMIIEASYTNEDGLTEKKTVNRKIRVEPDYECSMMLSQGQVYGNTYIDVMEIQDVYKGQEAVYPIRISNREMQNTEYRIEVTGLDGWGNFRVEPNNVIIVPSGYDRVINLYVWPQDVEPGERVFVVSIIRDEEVQRFLLISNVKERPERDYSAYWLFSLKVLLAFIVFALILIAITLALVKSSSRQRQSQRNYY